MDLLAGGFSTPTLGSLSATPTRAPRRVKRREGRRSKHRGEEPERVVRCQARTAVELQTARYFAGAPRVLAPNNPVKRMGVPLCIRSRDGRNEQAHATSHVRCTGGAVPDFARRWRQSQNTWLSVGLGTGRRETFFQRASMALRYRPFYLGIPFTSSAGRIPGGAANGSRLPFGPSFGTVPMVIGGNAGAQLVSVGVAGAPMGRKNAILSRKFGPPIWHSPWWTSGLHAKKWGGRREIRRRLGFQGSFRKNKALSSQMRTAWPRVSATGKNGLLFRAVRKAGQNSFDSWEARPRRSTAFQRGAGSATIDGFARARLAVLRRAWQLDVLRKRAFAAASSTRGSGEEEMLSQIVVSLKFTSNPWQRSVFRRPDSAWSSSGGEKLNRIPPLALEREVLFGTCEGGKGRTTGGRPLRVCGNFSIAWTGWLPRRVQGPRLDEFGA